ncbi:tyrosine-type recombinase/integrase [Bifidobacterium olomucense]|uniref:Tyr recombinase domain-containing protein n=1 Tax=Bifidobacterium olomucense TaxID=2675324 RepID=A0A7Y0EZF6_9BIFI|nr:tyrosine-type recombinase/integrase [Bifidobacterium sp. DSM 109959]NMM99222.1 hypothetical protein [Bifidobacterium sp. DSM 109959]
MASSKDSGDASKKRKEKRVRRKPIDYLPNVRLYEPTSNDGKGRYWRARVTLPDGRTSDVNAPTRDAVVEKAKAKLGFYVPGVSTSYPTVREAWDQYARSDAHDAWNSGTTQTKTAQMRRVFLAIGDLSVMKVTPKDIQRIDLEGISTNQQTRLRANVRALFDYTKKLYGTQDGTFYAGQMKVNASIAKENAAKRVVSLGLIPNTMYIASLITLTASTMNVTPLDTVLDAHDQMMRLRSPHMKQLLDPATASSIEDGTDKEPECITTIDPITGEKLRTSPWVDVPMEGYVRANPTDDLWRRGLPEQFLIKPYGTPHYTRDMQGFLRRQTLDRAERYRMLAAWFGIGAGGGLRIGEELALRISHLLTPAQSEFLFVTAHIQRWDEETENAWKIDAMKPGPTREGFYGAIRVDEQFTQVGSTFALGLPKWNSPGNMKRRTVHLPYYLPSPLHSGDKRSLREQIAEHAPRFKPHDNPENDASFWSSTPTEVGTLWAEGYVPIGWILLQRLTDLWNNKALDRASTDALTHDVLLGEKQANYQRMLLFPTRKPVKDKEAARNTDITRPEGWTGQVSVIPGTGNYIHPSNLQADLNPIFDYVSARLQLFPGAYPEGHDPDAKGGRKGWTHHSLRHYMASSRIAMGVPLTLISRELGHASLSTTINAYIQVLNEAQASVPPSGFEY